MRRSSLYRAFRGKTYRAYTYRPGVEQLEDRTVPAFIASQLNVPALPQLTLTTGQVQTLLQRAAVATGADSAIVAVVDRTGNILGVRVEGNVSSAVTGNSSVLDFSIDGAVSLARTGAFFSSNADPLTSRTVQFISQSTITQREVNSYTFNTDPSSTTGGPGFVAPIGIAGHFPPNVANTPQVDLFGIENTNRDLYVGPGADGRFGAGDQTSFSAGTERFNISLANVPGGSAGSQMLTAPLSYSDTIMAAAAQRSTAIAHVPSRGIATLPGGLPIYEDGVLIGGIGVFFPGTTGFASEENSKLSANYDPSKPDLSMEAEYIALAAVGGSKQAGLPVGAINGVPTLHGFDLPFPRIDLVGITLDTVGPGGGQGPQNLINYVKTFFSLNTGNPNSGINEQVDSNPLHTILPGRSAPDGWLVTPHAGGSLSAGQVQQIIVQGINTANQTRAQLRPLGSTTRMVFAVSDSAGDILGLYRMPDAPTFSINVAVSKARDAAYYDDPAQLLAVDQTAGIPAGASLTARTFRYLALPHFPEGIDPAPPGPWSVLNDPGTNPTNGLSIGAPQPISAFSSVFGYDAFHPNTTFHKAGANTSGVVFFPGSSGIYVNGKIAGGFGVSGDGVDEDDVVTSGGSAGFDPPAYLRADHFFFRGVRLPYQKFDRNPNG